jgi:hypothetical protein
MMLDELMRQLAASFAGLVIGWFCGSAYCKGKVLHLIEHREHVPRWSDSRGLGIVLIVLALITTLMSSVTSYRAQEQARCFTAYNKEFVNAYTARAIAADKDRASFNNLVISLGSSDQQVRARVFAKYIEDIKATDEERKKNPIPNPPDPSKYCDRR